jgi:hypothetical protein
MPGQPASISSCVSPSQEPIVTSRMRGSRIGAATGAYFRTISAVSCAIEGTHVHRDAMISPQHPGKQQAELARLLTPVRGERGVQAPLKTALGIPFGFAVPDQVNFGAHPRSKIDCSRTASSVGEDLRFGETVMNFQCRYRMPKGPILPSRSGALAYRRLSAPPRAPAGDLHAPARNGCRRRTRSRSSRRRLPPRYRAGCPR